MCVPSGQHGEDVLGEYVLLARGQQAIVHLAVLYLELEVPLHLGTDVNSTIRRAKSCWSHSFYQGKKIILSLAITWK